MSTERARAERDLTLHEKLDNLDAAVASLLEKDRNGGAHFTPDERSALRYMLKEQEFVRRFRKLVRIAASYTAAVAIFFYTLGDYVRLFFNALKAALR